MVLSIDIKCSCDQANECLSQLNDALDNLPNSLKERFKLLFDLPDLAEKLFTLEVDTSPTATDNLLVSLKPTDFFRMFLAALWAWDINGLIVE